MTITIKKQIVSSSVVSLRTYKGVNPIDTITVHQTGNTNKGADAQAHANIQTRLNSRLASWHYQVDDKEAIQSFLDSAQCYAAGDGRGPGNLRSIHIELCINSDGNYRRTLENGAKVVAQLLKRHGLSIDKVKQHYDWSRKNCPAQIRAGKDSVNWAKFIDMIKAELNGSSSASVSPAPKTKTKSESASTNKGAYTGGSLVDYLNSIGVDSRFKNRAKLAKQNGISNYSGTASQNTQLLNKLRGGGKAKAGPAKSSPKKSTPLPNATYYVKSPLYSGSGVRAVQEALASVYFYPEKGAKNNGIDGYYGAKTADAVKRFQSVNGLKEDGIYGAKTRAALLRA